jgi:hypothetical protein
VKKNVSGRFVLIGVGTLLVLLGVQAMAVKVAGTTTQATITQVKQVVNETSDKMDHNYRISYRFTVNGKDYTGSLDRKKVYNVTTLPAEGAAVPIKYLAAAPSLNGSADANPLTGILLGGFGVVLVVIGLKTGRGGAPAAAPAETPKPPAA